MRTRQLTIFATALAVWAACTSAARAALGELDATFGDNGLVRIDRGDEVGPASTPLVRGDGSVVVALGSDREWSVLRLNADGTPDATFGSGGRAVIAVRGTSNVSAVLEQADGGLVAAGSVLAANDTSQAAIARLLADGRLDTSFGRNGVATGPQGSRAAAVVQQSDGKLVMGGAMWSQAGTGDSLLIRVDTVGAIDTSFGTNGRVVVDAGGNASDHIEGLAQQPDGRLVAVGSARNSDMLVMRFTRDGGLDPSFGGTGIVLVSFAERRSAARAVAVQSDGKIVIAGDACTVVECGFETDAALVRLNGDGSVDSSFGDGGYVRFKASAYGYIAAGGLIVEPGGALVVGGEAWAVDYWWGPVWPGDGFVARLTQNGELDAAFGNGGVTLMDVGRGNETSAAASSGIARAADGTIVAVLSTWHQERQLVVARLAAAGGNPGALGLEYTVASAVEGHAATLVVRRTGGATGAVSIDYETRDGGMGQADWWVSRAAGAESGADFTATAGTLAWADGDTTMRTIAIPITADVHAEPEESFSLHLSNPGGGASLAASEGSITIASQGEPTAGNGSSDTSPPSARPASGGGSIGLLELMLLAMALCNAASRKPGSHRAV